MATTDIEPYRPYRGTLRTRLLRFAPLAASEIRALTKKKLPLLLLYGPPVIGTVIFSFVVYSRYAAERMTEDFNGLDALAAAFARQAFRNLEVKRQIIDFSEHLRVFSLLVVAWYGAGLFADDRRHGAHQLYFARPITRFDYFLAKFSVAAFFAAGVVLLPGLVICLVAALSSPNWSFLKDEGDVIPKTIAAAMVWIVTIATVVLCASSLTSRKAFALIGTFTFLMFEFVLARVLVEVTKDVRYHALSSLMNLLKISEWIFDMVEINARLDYDVEMAFWQIAAVVGCALIVIAFRLRRLEVVA